MITIIDNSVERGGILVKGKFGRNYSCIRNWFSRHVVTASLAPIERTISWATMEFCHCTLKYEKMPVLSK